MHCGIVSLFPQMFKALSDYGVTGRAVERGHLEISLWDPRDFSQDPYRRVDDRPYGGGPGMVMSIYPLRHAIQAAKQAAGGAAKVIYMSPQGERLSQAKVRQVVQQAEPLVFVAGRYEGVDERLLDLEVDEEWSIGDYVLSGGELAVMVAIDAMARWIPGVLGHRASAAQDSFSEGLLDCPHYTRPEHSDGLAVPAVLLEGDHQAIARWRLKQQLGRTWLRRPDLLERDLSAEETDLLQAFVDEYHSEFQRSVK